MTCKKDKPPLHHVDFFIKALEQVSRVSEFGAQKYGKGTWREGGSWSGNYDSARRHMTAWLNGETHDEESGLPNLAHAAWRLLAALEWECREAGQDDRAGALKDLHKLSEEMGIPAESAEMIIKP